MEPIEQRGYANPDRLVSTQWVADHKGDPDVLLVESNEDPLLYSTGHIDVAMEIDWTRDLNNPLTRDYLDEAGFEALMSRIGATRETNVVFYGDRNNWWATYALWVFSLFGHERTKIMDGGRQKWVDEGRPLYQSVPNRPTTTYHCPPRDDQTNRAFRDGVLRHMQEGKALVDVRSPEEFTGERLHMPAYPNEGALRGGHIPGARNVPWAKAVDPATGEFLPATRLRELYESGARLKPGEEVVTYCRIGERSSHTWFVLKYLLGYPNVRNYDGSWTEWGNLVGAPIER